jgi:hypothetical protein
MRRRPMIEYLVYAAVALMFIFGLGPMVWNGWRDHQLQTHGQQAKAKVLVITDTRSRINNNPVVDLQFSVMTEDGQSYAASLRTAISPVDLPRYQPGMTVDLVVDRKDPQRVALAK